MTDKITKRNDNRPLGEYLQNWAVLQPVLLSFTEKELKELYKLELKVRNREQIKKRIRMRLTTVAVMKVKEKVFDDLVKLEAKFNKEKPKPKVKTKVKPKAKKKGGKK